MKKLQLLALSMLLSTPFAVTYTSQDTSSSSVGSRADNQDGRQAQRADKRSELLKNLSNGYAEYSAAEAGSFDRANAKDKIDNSHREVGNHKQHLESRIKNLKSCADEKKLQIDTEIGIAQTKQATVDAGQEMLEGSKVASAMPKTRAKNLQSQVDDINKCVEHKQAMWKTLNRKISNAQSNLDALHAKVKAIKDAQPKTMLQRTADTVNDAASAVSRAAKSAATSVGLSK